TSTDGGSTVNVKTTVAPSSCSFPSGGPLSCSVNLNALSTWAAGNYNLYIRAMGKPSILNHSSVQNIVYTPSVISASPASLAFGTVSVGGNSQLSTTLTNTGAYTVQIASISTSSPFSVSHNCPSSLAANATCTATVTFTPGSASTFNGTLTIQHNGANGVTQVALSGTGAQATHATGSMSINGYVFFDSNCSCYDSSSVTVVINGFSVTESYDGFGLNGAADPQHLAQAFATDFNAGSSPVTAQAVAAGGGNWQVQ